MLHRCLLLLQTVNMLDSGELTGYVLLSEASLLEKFESAFPDREKIDIKIVKTLAI